MSQRRSAGRTFYHLAVAGLAAAALAGCSGSDGPQGPAGPNGAVLAPVSGATSLSIAITGVTVNSAPVVNFHVTNQNGEWVTGLTANDVRFTMAKLIPGSNGNSSRWQSYINTTATGAFGTRIQSTREGGTSGAFAGTFKDNGNGTYTYTFATDITKVTSPLAVPYDPGLTHRVGIQLRGSLPLAAATYTFRPSDGATSGIYNRDIVAYANCNQCHGTLEAHDERTQTQYCVTCHNPGSSDPDTGNTVDFKVMVHKIHMGDQLPSVIAGTPYQIIGYGGSVHDFSDVAFPQPIDNCTKCHDGTPGAANATPQGDNWKTQPSKEACGACHDDVNFATGANHPGGVQVDNSTCRGCHSKDGAAGPIEDSHSFTKRLYAAAAKFQFNIIGATQTAPGQMPVITFSVTDPTNGDKAYDIKTDPAFTAGSNSTLNVKFAWSTKDIGNTGSGQNYGQPVSVNVLGSAATPGSAPGTYQVTSTVALPATGTMRVFMDGHPAGDVTTAGVYTDRLPAKSVFRDFKVNDTSTQARRLVVDASKCDSCHAVLSLHGANRNNETGVCINCHNPNATDKSRRPAGAPAGTPDNKAEESIDFKRMIHAIHGADKRAADYPGAKFVVYGYGNSVNDFSDVGFPGVLNNCTTCHLPGTYELTGAWKDPTAAGIQGTTINTKGTPLDPSDNLRISPTASVCSACHDGKLAEAHMLSYGAVGVGGDLGLTQTDLNANDTETCSICHGPGGMADVKLIHGVK